MTDRFFIVMCAAVALVSQAPMPVVAQTDTDNWTVPPYTVGRPGPAGHMEQRHHDALRTTQ